MKIDFECAIVFQINCRLFVQSVNLSIADDRGVIESCIIVVQEVSDELIEVVLARDLFPDW